MFLGCLLRNAISGAAEMVLGLEENVDGERKLEDFSRGEDWSVTS